MVRLLPLNKTIIYSLPEGLWIFCITLTSRHYYAALNKWRIDGTYVPVIFCITLELFQLFHITNGRFDFMDIGMSAAFWLLGCLVLNKDHEQQNIFNQLNLKTAFCLASYGIVYLAHVMK